jgi:hypothetical protein
MPQNTEPPNGASSTETPTSFFNSAFIEINDSEIDSYFDYSAGVKAGQDSFKSPRLTPLSSPTLGQHLGVNPGGGWGNQTIRESIGSEMFQNFSSGSSAMKTVADMASRAQNSIILLQTNSFGQPSPPNSSSNSPDKYAPPGDISPLDSLISHVPTDSSRRVHGQVTPPDDANKSPVIAHTSLVLPTRLTPPERTPMVSPRRMSPRQRATSMSEQLSGASGTLAPTAVPRRRRRSSSGQTVSRRQRKGVSFDEHPQDVQEAKRRRFLERNRVAASKCRQKKKAWMQDLESDARTAQNTSRQLKAVVGMLREEILQLKNELLKHNTCDCAPIRQYLNNEAIRLAEGVGNLGNLPRLGNPPELGNYATDAANAAATISSASSKAAADNEAKLSSLMASPEFDLDYVDNAEAAMV